MRIALAQLNPLVGDLDGNAARIRQAYREAVAAGADLVAVPELGICGYPPEDLLLKPAFLAAVEETVTALAGDVGAVPLVVGTVQRREQAGAPGAARAVTNAAAVLREGAVVAWYHKQHLPNYGVFDEARYFVPGTSPLTISVAGTEVGITICEDLWGDGAPVQAAARAGAQVVLNLNASPYSRGKRERRERHARRQSRVGDVWIAYVNQIGGQDEIVFDGDSFVMAPDGRITARAAQFTPDLLLAEVPADLAAPSAADPRLDEVAEVYAAVLLGLRDYAEKNGFARALVGLSGGIDSALALTVAADALGAERVTGVTMPAPVSSPGSVADSEKLAANLGVAFVRLSISPVLDAFHAVLDEHLEGNTELAEENLQPRVRGTLLMTLSNASGDLVLATGNKSEYAVGYATLYGDMAGGFAPLKDVPKTLVYELCRYRNTTVPELAVPGAARAPVPEEILTKPPTAELRPDQRDTDALPAYEVLDPILEAYIEDDRSVREIVDLLDVEAALVAEVIRMVDRAEYKRRQAPPGTKISDRAFGKDRRLPITQGWREPTSSRGEA